MLDNLRQALAALTDSCYHYFAKPGTTPPYLVWAEDSDNDLTMLRMAGLGVAMENAAPHIRAAADAVTGSNAADGVAQAIYRYILEGNA